jgi:hypothetical protein
MTDFLAAEDRRCLSAMAWHFRRAVGLQLDAVDEPNTGRGGWSSVFRLELEGRATTSSARATT